MEYSDRFGKMEYVLRTIVPKNYADPVIIFNLIFRSSDKRLLELVSFSDELHKIDSWDLEDRMSAFRSGNQILFFIEHNIKNMLYNTYKL